MVKKSPLNALVSFITEWPQSTQQWVKNNRVALFHACWLFLFAWIIRLTFIWIGGYSFLGMDEHSYLRGATEVLNGNFTENYFMPGWFYVLSWAMRLSIEPRFFVSILGGLTVPFIFLIGRNIFDTKTGVIAALIYALYPEHIFYSHYVQAEVALGLIVAIATWTAFSSRLSIPHTRLYIVSFFLGISLLYKHFAVIPFFALIFTIALNRRKITLPMFLALLIFISPVAMYSVRTAMHGGDILLLFNSPLKSLKEWDKNKPSGRIPENERKELFKQQTKKILSRDFFHATQVNLYNLWSPNSLPITRLARDNYHWTTNPYPIMVGFSIYHTLLILLGLAGLCWSASSAFSQYTWLNLILITGMTCFWFMVSRYRLPFMFFFALYAAHLVANPSIIFSSLPRRRMAGGIFFLTLLIGLTAIYINRWPRLGSWQ